MIFLIGKIFIYLVLAVGIGGAAGWLMRNLQAQRAEEAAQRAMHDAKAKLPQLESLLRGRDEQLTKLKDQLVGGKALVNESDQAVRALEQKLRDQERETKKWRQTAEAKSGSMGDSLEIVGEEDQTETNNLIAQLSQEIERLKRQLEEQPTSPVAPAASGADETMLQVEVDTLQSKLSSAERALQVATAELQEEQNKVGELERERELQSKSLQVLHQQLELERTRRVANG